MHKLLRDDEAEQRSAGCFHTLREIRQQPDTWLATASQLCERAGDIAAAIEGVRSVTLTGSGSSEYAGECVRLSLRRDLGVDVRVISGGDLLANGAAALPAAGPGLMVSLARSGDSPESIAALRLARALDPKMRQMIITCNADGALAKDAEALKIVLDARTNDRSLVMTSSFTNLSLAARFLGFDGGPVTFKRTVSRLAACGTHVLESAMDPLSLLGSRRDFHRVVFLGGAERFGAAREAALKMLEMTAGRVSTMAETFLGLRHGPMTYVREDALVVCFLSAADGSPMRAYEEDLIAELDRKGIGIAKLLVGELVPAALVRSGDTVIELPGLSEIGNANSSALYVLVGQLLALFRCLAEGLEPDSPSRDGVISRVVGSFAIHNPELQPEPAVER